MTRCSSYEKEGENDIIIVIIIIPLQIISLLLNKLS